MSGQKPENASSALTGFRMGIMVGDYVQALQEFRAWHVLHQGDYEIIKEGFEEF